VATLNQQVVERIAGNRQVPSRRSRNERQIGQRGLFDVFALLLCS
jgi:hypothetical protein